MKTVSFHFPTQSLEKEKIKTRQELCQSLRDQNAFPHLFSYSFDPEVVGKKNCENLVGSVQVPVGIAGPLRCKTSPEGDVLLPLATTEGALVASVNRGCKAITQSGGVSLFVEKIGITRAPVFACRNGREAREFITWIEANFTRFQAICGETSTHVALLSFSSWIRGRYVFVRFVFDTQEAMGMNMVSIAVEYLWQKVQSEMPSVRMIALSGNVCADKKEAGVNRIMGRGYRVQADALITTKVLAEVLHTTAEKLVEVHTVKNLIGSNVAGSLSQNMHAGNIIAFMFLSTGQDLAHVTDGSQVSTLIEATVDGVYCSVTIPSLLLGTVGGGTDLPAQREARNLIKDGQPLTAIDLAGVIGGAVLAGEISGLCALATHSLASAHKKLGRLSTIHL